MAGSFEDKWAIDKLDGTNWGTWKFQVRHLLLAKGLWKYVDGSTELAQDADANARQEFNKNSQIALSNIVLGMKTSQLYLVTSCTTPKDAWDALRNHFERDTLANKILLKKRYFRAEMSEQEAMESHLKHMKDLADKLASLGCKISEEDHVVTLLGSLPRDYAALVTALEARSDDLSLTYVQQALLREEEKLKRSSSESVKAGRGGCSGDSAMAVKEMRCFGCKQPGHKVYRCPSRRKKTCKPRNRDEAKNAVSTLDSEGDGGDLLFSACSGSSTEADAWIVDSGASRHMTRERNRFCEYKAFNKSESVA